MDSNIKTLNSSSDVLTARGTVERVLPFLEPNSFPVPSDALEREIRDLAASLMEVPPEALAFAGALALHGLDFLKAMELEVAIEKRFGFRVPMEALVSDASPETLARMLREARRDQPIDLPGTEAANVTGGYVLPSTNEIELSSLFESQRLANSAPDRLLAYGPIGVAFATVRMVGPAVRSALAVVIGKKGKARLADLGAGLLEIRVRVRSRENLVEGGHEVVENHVLTLEGLAWRLVLFLGISLSLGSAISLGSRSSNFQTLSMPAQHWQKSQGPIQSVCEERTTGSAAGEALRFVCQRGSIVPPSSLRTAQIIVIGFVGGFAKPDDETKSCNVFASYLREHYPAEIHAKIFSHHDEGDAMSYVTRLLRANHNGALSDEERKRAAIIIYGHSWGASESVAFARELGRAQIPVLLLILLDIIPKPGQMPDQIPANVARAINFYQSEGLVRGLSKIVASDPAHTTILGNIRMSYDRSSVKCDNTNWLFCTFNKPHHQIVNDPNIWNQAAGLIDAEVSRRDQARQPPPSLAISERGMHVKIGREPCCIGGKADANIQLNGLTARP